MSEAPLAKISGFHQDDDGVWVADLECGHAQHVRHDPPWQRAEWVVTEAGREQHLGTSLPCPLCRMPKLPEGALEYKRTADFDRATVPPGLLKRHALKAETWGEIVVTEGRVLYTIEDAEEATFALRPGVRGVVAPEQPHHVEVAEGARFYVRFLRVDPAD